MNIVIVCALIKWFNISQNNDVVKLFYELTTYILHLVKEMTGPNIIGIDTLSIIAIIIVYSIEKLLLYFYAHFKNAKIYQYSKEEI